MFNDVMHPSYTAMIMMFILIVMAVMVGVNPLLLAIRRREEKQDRVLRSALLLSITPRAVTIMTGILVLVLATIGFTLMDGSVIALTIFGAVGVILPVFVIRWMVKRRLEKLEEQLVGAIQTLASGVRAGLNLVQGMQMVARDAPDPIRQEFSHLVQEYEYGIPLDEAMENSAARIGSSDFRLLFTALRTHRERGGNLGETLDRIALSIREIQRLDNKVRTETAQGRATARWLGALPGVVLGMLFLISGDSVTLMFVDPLGKGMLGGVVLLNLIGYLWIRKVMQIDI
jgi:tight adherence protein B